MAPKELFRFLGLLWPILSVCWGLGGCCCGDSVALDTTSSLDGDTIAVTFDVDSLCDTYRADPSLNGIVGQCVCDISPKQLPPDTAGTFPVTSPAPVEPVMDSIPMSFDAPCPTYPQPASYSETYWAAKYGLTVGSAATGDSLQADGQIDTLLPNATVFGWHPYWMGSAYREYNFSLLSAVAYFSYELDQQTGGYTSVAQWKNTELVDAAHQYGTRVLLTVSSCGEFENAAFLSDPALHQVLADSLIALLQLKNGDGVALAFQQVPASASTGFSQLVATLRQRLQAANPNFQLVVAVPGSTTLSAYRIRDLQPNVDYFVINGYNYHDAHSAVA
ncbi:MAG: glycosyl hydrolase family 18 protein, partial [Bacteroidota bacterium]